MRAGKARLQFGIPVVIGLCPVQQWPHLVDPEDMNIALRGVLLFHLD